MTTCKTTKRALLFSVLSLLLCASMLVGSTFAWFTDSVTAGKNKIVAGNLDVELYAKTGADYTPVTSDTNLFLEGALWEPGHVEVVNLKVANLGTLALKYQLGINIANEIGSINKEDNPFKLSDHIKFALLDGEQTFEQTDAERTRAIETAEANNPQPLSEMAVDKNGVLYPEGTTGKESEKKVTLIVYMPTNVGNVANYMTGKDVPTIELGVKLVATQTPYEEDGFGTDYDANAEYPMALAGTVEGFIDALQNPANDTVVLTDHIEITSQTPAVATDNVTIDLNGKSLTASGSLALKKEEKTYMTQEDYDNLVMEQGKDYVENIFGKPEDCVGTYPIHTEYKPVAATIQNGTYIVKNNGSGRVRFESGSSCVFENVTFKSDSKTLQKALQVYANENAADKNTYVFKNCTFENTFVSFEGGKGNFDVSFENCRFNIEKPGNSSAAIYFARNTTGTLSVSDCVFHVKNNTKNRNYAIYHEGGNGENQGTKVEVTLNNVSFTGEKIAKPSYYGGGYFISACVGEGNTGVLHITETGTNSYVLICGEETVTTDCWSTDQNK